MSGPGDTLVAGRYRVRERLGAGGMGVVYRATDTRLKRDVALKRVLTDGGGDDSGDGAAEARARMLREAEIAARVHHPRIVSVFDVLDDPGGPILVLEYLPSRSLAALVADVGVLVPGACARIGAQIAEALAAAHAAGIVHRDVKPGNVLVGPGDPAGPAKLADFGISHLPGTTTPGPGGIGTPAYVAPEIARGERATPASDVYALGATLVATARGTPPFGRGDANPLELIRRIAQDPVPAPGVGGPFGALLARMTATDPADRPSAERAATELWRLADRPEPSAYTGPTAPPAGAPSEPTHDPGRGVRRWRRRSVLVAAGLAVVLAVAGGVVVTTGGPAAPLAPAPPAFPAAVPALSVGDPRTADPCSLVRPAALAGFGAPTLVPDADGFALCEIDVAQRGSDVVQVSTEFRPPSLDLPRGDRQRLGDAFVVRSRTEDGGCQRWLVLSDGTPVDVRTRFYGEGDPVADVCAVAEAAVASAATTAATSGIGRREPPSAGLWTRDACTLLTPADLSFLPPEHRTDPYRGFAGWSCDWSDGDDPGLSVTVNFARYAVPATPVPGTPAFLASDADDRCAAQVPKRRFTALAGDERAETLRVLVHGPRPKQELCDRAVRLAVAADGRA